MSNYLKKSSLNKVKLNDYNVYIIIQKIQRNKRNAVWSADFDHQKDIRVLRINYDNKTVMMNNVNKNCYVVFKNYY